MTKESNKEWALLLDLLIDIVSNNNVYSQRASDKLQELINCVERKICKKK